METTLQDLRYGFRMLRKSPLFTTVAILTLALGIGANTAIFSVVNNVLLKPLPFDRPERVMLVAETWQGLNGRVSAGNFIDWQQQTTAFERLAAGQVFSFNLATREAPERIVGNRVTHNFFSVFGVAPILGRTFAPAEDQPGGERVVVLSESTWKRRFQSDPSILGRTVQIDGSGYTVIGVMPANFDPLQSREEFWVPVAFTPERKAQHDEHSLFVVGRLKPEFSMAQAQSEMDTIAHRQALKYPQEDGDRGAHVSRLDDVLLSSFRPGLYMLLGSVGFVLLIACSNIGNLQLVRSRARSKETAIRSALGASPRRLLQQLAIESIVLASMGGCFGLATAYCGLRWLVRAAPDIPRLDQARLDGWAVLFTFGATLLSAVLFGAWAAWRTAFSDTGRGLADGVRGSVVASRDRVRSALVVSEVALALMLLAGAGLLLRSAWMVSKVDVGFDSCHLLIGRVSLPSSRYSSSEDSKSAFRRILEETQRLPGVETAAVVSNAPLKGSSTNGLIPEGRPLESASAINSRFNLVSPDYFHAVRIPLKQGRIFGDGDRAGALRVMVINEALARMAFADQNPIGKRIACCEGDPYGKPVWKEVVGVVGDVHAWGLDQDVQPEFYLPIAQAPPAAWDWIQRSMDIVVRSTAKPSALTSSVRQAVLNVDAGVPLYDIETMEQRISASLEQSHFNTLLMTVFAAVALLLSAAGIYGVLSYLVVQRTHEIGIRTAIGARQGDIFRLIIAHGMKLVLIGILVGVLGALLTSHLLSSLLFEIRATDFITLFAVSCVLVVVALLASFVPAWRAAKVDPMVALRYE
jgi:putative ABC transport system permease protein